MKGVDAIPDTSWKTKPLQKEQILQRQVFPSLLTTKMRSVVSTRVEESDYGSMDSLLAKEKERRSYHVVVSLYRMTTTSFAAAAIL